MRLAPTRRPQRRSSNVALQTCRATPRQMSALRSERTVKRCTGASDATTGGAHPATPLPPKAVRHCASPRAAARACLPARRAAVPRGAAARAMRSALRPLLLLLLLALTPRTAGVPVPAWRALAHRLAPRLSSRGPRPPGPELSVRGNLMFWKARPPDLTRFRLRLLTRCCLAGAQGGGNHAAAGAAARGVWRQRHRGRAGLHGAARAAAGAPVRLARRVPRTHAVRATSRLTAVAPSHRMRPDCALCCALFCNPAGTTRWRRCWGATTPRRVTAARQHRLPR